MKLLLPIVAVGAAVALAFWAVGEGSGPSVPEPPRPGLARARGTGRSPAFHRFLKEDAALGVAREILGQVTSAPAEVLGDLKDDLALVAEHESVRTLILEDFEQRVRISEYEAAAFGDLFALVKDPQFVDPTRRLVEHEKYAVRLKSLGSIEVQKNPSLVVGLSRLMDELLSDHEGRGSVTQERIVRAAAEIGGTEAASVVAKGLQSPVASVRGAALTAIREHQMTGLRSRVEALLEDPDREVRRYAAWALGTLGDPRAISLLLANYDNQDVAGSATVIDALRDLKDPRAIPGLRGKLLDAPPELASRVNLCLAVLGDAPTAEALRSAVKGQSATLDDRLAGLVLMAAMGNAEDVRVLRDIASRGSFGELMNISIGLGHRDTVDRDLAVAMLDSGHFQHPGQVGSWVPRVPDFAPWLLQRLDDETDPNKAILWIGCLMELTDPAVVEQVWSRQPRFPDLVEQAVRASDLKRRKEVGVHEG